MWSGLLLCSLFGACSIGACSFRSLDALSHGATVNDGGSDAGRDARVATEVDAGDAGDAGEQDAAIDAGREDSGADAGSTAPMPCEERATSCATATAQRTCVGGEWSEPEACEHACIRNACGGECAPGERECEGAQRVRCNDDGEWTDNGEPCASLCVRGACEGACVPTTKQCVSSIEVQTCDGEGRWGGVTTCPFACVGDACGGACVPGSRTCLNGRPNACSEEGAWLPEAECPAVSPVCVGAGQCRCQPGATRCAGNAATQPQVCSASNQWTSVGEPCANCERGQCSGEGCPMEQLELCEMVGCNCASGACSGGFCEAGDGCTAPRRAACAAIDCGCVDGLCSGGLCAGNGCTGREQLNCSQVGCDCSLHSCAGGACTD
jgi:hypothetical protein